MAAAGFVGLVHGRSIDDPDVQALGIRGEIPLGLVLRFDAEFIRDGIARAVNGLPEDQNDDIMSFLCAFAALRLCAGNQILVCRSSTPPTDASALDSLSLPSCRD